MSRKATNGFAERGDTSVPERDGDPRADRPTTRPPFDPAKFAREAESTLTTSEPPASERPTPRAFPCVKLTAAQRGRAERDILSSAPDVEEVATSTDARDALGSEMVPVLVASREELEWFALSSEANSLLSFVDGDSQIDSLCVKANLTSTDAARILLELAEQGIVSFR